MKHKRKTRRAPQKHGSRRKKKKNTMRRIHVHSKAKKKTGGFFKKTLSKSKARATAIIKRYRERLEQLLYDIFKGVSDKFPIVPTVQDLRDAGKSEDEITRAAYNLCDKTVKGWPVEPKEPEDIDKLYDRIRDAFHDAKKRIKKYETEKKEKEQEICESDDYKKVVKAIANLNIPVSEVDTIVSYIFEDDLPEDLTGVTELKDLEDHIKELEKIIKEELDSDTDSKKWLQENLSGSVKKDINRRTRAEKLAGLLNRPPPTVPSEQQPADTPKSGAPAPDIGSIILLKTKPGTKGTEYDLNGWKAAKVIEIKGDTFRYVVHEGGGLINNDDYNDKLLHGGVTCGNEPESWKLSPKKTDPLPFIERYINSDELKQLNIDYQFLDSAAPVASAPVASAPVASAPAPAPSAPGDRQFTLQVIFHNNRKPDIKLIVKGSDSVKSVKAKIQDQMNIPTNEQVLLSGDKVLGKDPLDDKTTDNDSLEEKIGRHGISSGDVSIILLTPDEHKALKDDEGQIQHDHPRHPSECAEGMVIDRVCNEIWNQEYPCRIPGGISCYTSDGSKGRFLPESKRTSSHP
jgi:hypothetical protein